MSNQVTVARVNTEQEQNALKNTLRLLIEEMRKDFNAQLNGMLIPVERENPAVDCLFGKLTMERNAGDGHTRYCLHVNFEAQEAPLPGFKEWKSKHGFDHEEEAVDAIAQVINFATPQMLASANSRYPLPVTGVCNVNPEAEEVKAEQPSDDIPAPPPEPTAKIIRFIGHDLTKDEDSIVRYYPVPEVDGESLCEDCDNPMKEHGWIDPSVMNIGIHGLEELGVIVCPNSDIVCVGDVVEEVSATGEASFFEEEYPEIIRTIEPTEPTEI